MTVIESWQYFNYENIKQEAISRLNQARLHHQNIGPLDTIEYWTAWVAHANLTSIVSEQ